MYNNDVYFHFRNNIKKCIYIKKEIRNIYNLKGIYAFYKKMCLTFFIVKTSEFSLKIRVYRKCDSHLVQQSLRSDGPDSECGSSVVI